MSRCGEGRKRDYLETPLELASSLYTGLDRRTDEVAASMATEAPAATLAEAERAWYHRSGSTTSRCGRVQRVECQ